MNEPVKRRRSRRCRAVLLAAVAASTPPFSHASNTDNFVGASGSNWNNSSNWVIAGTSTHLIPGAGDTVNIIESPASLFSVTFDGNYTAGTAINTLFVDGSPSFGVALNQGTAGQNLFSGTEYIGLNGIASFNQTAATNSLTGSLSVGANSSGQGSYLLSGGADLSATNVYAGESGHGSFVQTGGTVSLLNSGGMIVGRDSGSSGIYQMSGGTITGGHVLDIGSSGSGSFLQTAGVANFDFMFLADSSGGSGSYSLSSSGTMTLSSAYVGGGFGAAGGTGALAISGGNMTVGGLKVWNTPGTSVSLSGGTLNVGTLDLSGSPFLFNWTGGTLNFTNPITINSSFALGSTIYIYAPQTLTTTLGLTNNGQIYLSGGTLGGAGAILNGTGLISGYGTIGGSGGFSNSGNITQGGGSIVLSNSGPNSNTGNIDLAVGNQLQLAGGNLANTGTINLNGATITGPAQVNNNAGGVIAGRGAITAALTNSGTIALNDGTLNLPAFTNNGTISPNGVTANVSGGAISNALNIEGFGQINNNLTNTATGMIAPLGGRLILNGIVTNSAGGFITASSGNELDVALGLGTNSGLISLTGGTLNTNSQSLTNSGTISGYGVLRTGGLTNNTQMTLSGGTSTVNGPVINSGRIDVKYSTAVFNGAVTNNAGATFKTTGASVAFVGPFTNNGTYNSDPSTNYFTDWTIGPSGSVSGGVGDNFYVSGNFTNNSTQTGTWNTSGALLGFQGGVSHQASVAGSVGQFGWGTIQINAGDSVTVNGNSLTAASTVNNGSLSHISGTSSLGTLSGTGSLSVGNAAGGAAAAVTVASINQSSVTVNATGTLDIAHSATPAVSNTNSLTINPGGRLDLSNSTLFIHYGASPDPLSTIVGYVANGYNHGAWNGPGIISTTAAANTNHTTEIGIADSAHNIVSGLAPNTIELKYTILGDANLDGTVNSADLQILLFGFNTLGRTWDQADFNYDGTVNSADLQDLLFTFNTSLGPTTIPGADAVPEPAGAALVLLGGAALVRRRQRHRAAIPAADRPV